MKMTAKERLDKNKSLRKKRKADYYDDLWDKSNDFFKSSDSPKSKIDSTIQIQKTSLSEIQKAPKKIEKSLSLQIKKMSLSAH